MAPTDGPARTEDVPAPAAGCDEVSQPVLWRWRVFARERFPLGTHLPMVVCFAGGDLCLTSRAIGAPVAPARIGVVLLVTLFFFFRLRCFDEIKDLDGDRLVNPTRPLARGLLTVPAVGRMIAVLTVLELLLAAGLGVGALLAHGIAVAYSFLMYCEFFIGRWLRPRLTLYAVTHTAVSILLGYSIAVQAAARPLTALPWPLLLFGPVNWMLFNVFEFARKTYAPQEERTGVETYSSLYGPWGAVLLTASQIAVALALLGLLPETTFSRGAWLAEVFVAALVLAVAGVFAARRTVGAARLFRGSAGAFLLVFYLLIIGDWLTHAVITR
jgi:4-hydroxybenzoate polyprenyltransferase